MRSHRSRSGGYITVYCTLTFMVLMSLIMLLVEGARSNGARFMSEYALDVGQNSILAEYHRELFKKYNLLFIDTSYGTGVPELGKTAEHLRGYMDKNLSIKGVAVLAGSADLYGLYVNDTSVTSPSYITDCDAEVFRQQAVEERRQMLGLRLATDITGIGKAQDLSDIQPGKYDDMREEVEAEIDAARNTKIKVSEDRYEDVEINNPADGPNSKRGMGILNLAIKDPSGLSEIKVDLDNRLSKRAINIGVGPNPDKYAEETYADKLLFKDYLKTYFGCYLKEKEDSYLKYEREYILMGKASDIENLEAVAWRIFGIREAVNTEFLFGNAPRRAAIKSVAATVAAITMIPGLDVLIEYSILFAWSFAESVADLRCIFSGGKVPLIKTDATWKTDLTDVLENAFMDADGDAGGEGMGYEDYIDSFMLVQDTEIQSIRALDTMELALRKTEGNASFRIDGCIEGMTVTANVKSKYGEDYYLTRNVYY